MIRRNRKHRRSRNRQIPRRSGHDEVVAGTARHLGTGSGDVDPRLQRVAGVNVTACQHDLRTIPSASEPV